MVFPLVVLFGAFIASATLTWAVRKLALAYGVVDLPDGERKLHFKPTPLLGGLGIYLSFSGVVLLLASFTQSLIGKDVNSAALLGLVGGGAWLMLGGYLDDRFRLRARYQLLWPLLAALTVVVVGLGPKVLSSPWGGYWHLSPMISAALAFVWLMGMMYTTKLLDGLDGLATGVGAIGSLIIFGLTQFTPFYQPSVGLLSLALAGAALGFLLWNWHPAKIFLGEGGSLYLGFGLGVLSIISGAKIATALLVMGIPILDVAWVIVRRVFWDKKSVAAADRKHLHYRLLEIGFSHRQAVLLLYTLATAFGVASLFLGTVGKLAALGLLLGVMVFLGTFTVSRLQKK
jgi:UDP-GlcNAc:undecaprenyl-phosphate GlcNAc-1-phosphate transferase